VFKLVPELNEISRILLAIKYLSGKEKPSNIGVIRYCQGQVIEGRFPNHSETITFCRQIKLINIENQTLSLTEIGDEILTLNNENELEMNEAQKEFLILKCILNTRISLDVATIIKQFSITYSKRSFIWSESDSLPLVAEKGIITLLIQLGFFTETKNGLIVSSKYAIYAAKLRAQPNYLSPEKLARELDYSKKIGEIAEEIVLEFEKMRLIEDKQELKASLVQKISDLDVSAGYDIISFNGDEDDLLPNRYIEVKGSNSKEMKFYWSRNEIEKAILLGNKYWIYFVGGVTMDTKEYSTGPIIIQNPVEKIFENPDFEVIHEVISVRHRNPSH
jgi:hypothetical protein